MTALEFVYWLNGHIELEEASGNAVKFDEKQVKVIKDHISLVLTKVTPKELANAVWGDAVNPKREAKECQQVTTPTKIWQGPIC